MNLIDYINKKVRITTTKGKVFEGNAISYENAIESGESCDSIAIEYPTYVGVQILENEIKELDLI
jgi:hypothetical protein